MIDLNRNDTLEHYQNNAQYNHTQQYKVEYFACPGIGFKNYFVESFFYGVHSESFPAKRYSELCNTTTVYFDLTMPWYAENIGRVRLCVNKKLGAHYELF